MGLRQLCLGLLVLGGLVSAAQASIRFDAAADALTRTTGLPAFGDLTIMVWAYRTADIGATDECLLGLVDSTAYNSYFDICFLNTPATVKARCQLPGNYMENATGFAMATVTWTHLAMVFDNTADTLSLYVNGALHGSAFTTGTGTTTWGFEILGNLLAGNTARLDGRLAAYKAFAAVLTAAQIQAEMAYFVVVKPTGLVGYSPLRTATEVASYGGGTAWTVNGTLTTEADPPLRSGVSPGNPFLSW